MPSPFPGMDPWLESPLEFGGLHGSLIFLMKQSLQKILPPPYYADSEDRIYMDLSFEDGGQVRIPDVNVMRGDDSPMAAPVNGGVAVATGTETETIVIRNIVQPNDDIREAFVNVYTQRGGEERLVTSIEVLSPTNKSDTEGRAAYRKKQAEMIAGEIHLVEIDLLRAGRHVTRVPKRYLRKQVKNYDYHICITRADEPQTAYVQPFRLSNRLPKIAIPLMASDGNIGLDLQPIFDAAYDAGPYRRRVKYAKDEPDPPLTPEQRAWAEERLIAAGLVAK